MEKRFDNIIIGFGKGGKTLAAALAAKGQSTAIVEKDANMYGGTCINVACIPSKSLEHSARLSAAQGGDFEVRAKRYSAAIAQKRSLCAMLRQKNYEKAIASGVSVLTGSASFTDPHHVSVSYPNNAGEELFGQRIFINTGARPFIPPVPGLRESRFAYTSETLMELDSLPRRLAVIGGGYIGLEFASYYTNFGSEVTVIQDQEAFIPREDAQVASAVYDSFTRRGIRILKSTKTVSVEDKDGFALIALESNGAHSELEADAILVATGRRPNLDGLNIEAAGVALTERGAIKTDDHLQTSVPHIYAMGDVAGGLQFTYISLDDSRIVKSALLGDGSRTVKNRGAVPYTVFIDPPLSRVGLSEEEARNQGFATGVATLPCSAIPKAHVLRKPEGMLKVIVDTETGMFLGAHFFCAESQEMINLIKLCMDASIPYTVIRDGIFNHPTMSEALNDLLSAVK